MRYLDCRVSWSLMVLSSTRVGYSSDFYELITRRVVKDKDQVQMQLHHLLSECRGLHTASASSCLSFDVTVNT